MTPRVAAGLNDDDVREVRAEVAAGRSAAVWFTAAAVGVPAGRSAKIVAVGDASEGEFLQVRPAGSKDTVSCSPDELTRTRPARRRPDPEPTPTPRAAAGSAPTRPAAATPRPATPRPAEPATVDPAPTRPAATTSGPAADRPPEPAPGDPEPTRPAAAADGPPPRRPAAKRSAAAATGGTDTAAPTSPPADAPSPAARTSGRTRSGADPLSVCLTATPEGEWSVEVLAGRKRIVPPTPVPAGALAAAARSLPPVVAEAIEASLEHARQRQRERVARLREELDAAQRVLEEFDA